MELKESVKEKLSDVVNLWAEDNLIGKPALLASAVYFALEKELLRKQKEIEDTFGKWVLLNFT
jgi:hypothetical protein